MPHVIVKLYEGRTEEQKSKLADEITKAVMTALKPDEKTISVAIEDVKPEQWPETVYKPDILAKPEKLYRKPGYNPFA